MCVTQTQLVRNHLEVDDRFSSIPSSPRRREDPRDLPLFDLASISGPSVRRRRPLLSLQICLEVRFSPDTVIRLALVDNEHYRRLRSQCSSAA
jgi:hypothetical protein